MVLWIWRGSLEGSPEDQHRQNEFSEGLLHFNHVEYSLTPAMTRVLTGMVKSSCTLGLLE